MIIVIENSVSVKSRLNDPVKDYLMSLHDNTADTKPYHERRYLKLLENITQGTVFKKSAPVKWMCRNCGYVHESSEAPTVCPVCNHPRSHFEIWTKN